MHSLFSASSAHRWLQCPGSIALSELVQAGDNSSPAAAEGTMLHEVTNYCLERDTAISDVPLHKLESKPDFLTDEQEEAVQFCIDKTQQIEGGTRLYEVRVNYGETLNQPASLAFGTGDVAIINGNHLHIIDFKFGRRYVNPENNLQMSLYAFGVLEAVRAIGEDPDTVSMHIFQPRVSSEPTPWTIPTSELDAAPLKAAARQVITALESKHTPEWEEAHLHPSESACVFCPAKHICPKLRGLAHGAAERAPAAVDEFEGTKDMDEDLLSQEMANVPLLEAYIKAIQQETTRRLSLGQKVPGFKMIHGRKGNRKWGDERTTEEIAEFVRQQGLENAYAKPSLLSPTQAATELSKVIHDTDGGTKKAAKEKAEEALAPAVVRSPSKPTVVTEDTPGEPWQSGVSVEEFEV